MSLIMYWLLMWLALLGLLEEDRGAMVAAVALAQPSSAAVAAAMATAAVVALSAETSEGAALPFSRPR